MANGPHDDQPAGDGAAGALRGPSALPRSGHEAIAVETVVVERAGRWAVEIVVVFPDEAIRREVNVYSTRRRAEIAADWIRRGADRDPRGTIEE